MTLTIREVPALDAAPDATTLYYLPDFAARFAGRLAHRHDEDRVRIELAAGETYTIDLAGRGADGVADTLLTLYDADGHRLARNDDVDLQAGNRHSQLIFTPDRDGTYYLSAAAYTGNPARDNAGAYVLSVSPRPGTGQLADYRAAGTGVRATLPEESGEREEAVPWALAGSAHGDTLTGNAGDNWLFGNGGQDTLHGGGGADWLYAGPGRVVLTGGPGADVLVGDDSITPDPDSGTAYAWAAYADSPGGVSVSLALGAGAGADAEGDVLHRINGLIGSAHGDTLTGDALGNELWGGPGEDTLRGGGLSPGHWDYLEGGPGADVLIGSARGDAGNASFAAYRQSPAGVTVDLAHGTGAGGDAEGDTLTAIDSLLGSRYADTLTGNDENNVLAGAGGDDALNGRAGDDVLYGEHIAGRSHAGGNDILNGGAGDDTLIGGPGADVLAGGDGADTASWAGSGTGVVVRLHSASARGGDAAGDVFAAFVTVAYTDANGHPQRGQVPDIEHLHGSNHNDVLAGDSRANTLAGRGGDDILYGGPGGGDDALYGGAGHDRLYGGRGQDSLHGHAGHDTLSGGPGEDTLFGGAGNDVFVFAPGHGDDLIRDFGRGDDRIDLSAFDAIDSPDDLALSPGKAGLTIDLTGHGGGVLTLEGYDPGGLGEGDFIF